MEITSEIFQIGGSGFTSSEDAAIYLINFNGHAAIVDAGCGHHMDILEKNMRLCNVQPKQIETLLITHCHFDHTGGAAALQEKFNCSIVAHSQDAEFLEKGDDTVTAASWYGERIQLFRVDRKLVGSHEEIRLGDRKITAIHIPGHSPGSVAYVTESDGMKVVFAQDVHGSLDPSLLSNRKDYLASLEKLISIKADLLCEGHYGIYRGKRDVEQFIRSFLM